MTLHRVMHFGWSLVAGAGVFLASSANAADAPSCKLYDAQAACCPHPAPSCCPASLSVPLDDATIVGICGTGASKGEAAGIDTCKHYYLQNEVPAEVSFARQAGGAAKLAKLRESLAGDKNKISTITVAGATSAFLVREGDEDGKPMRLSAWGLVGTEVLSVEAEVSVCDDKQVVRLLVRAVERVRQEKSPPKTATATTHPPG